MCVFLYYTNAEYGKDIRKMYEIKLIFESEKSAANYKVDKENDGVEKFFLRSWEFKYQGRCAFLLNVFFTGNLAI